MSYDSYKKFFLRLCGEFFGHLRTSSRSSLIKNIHSASTLLVDRFSDLLNHTAILDFHYTSALLHIPRSLCSNIEKIVSQSGYIYSAGIAIYTRNVDKFDEYLERNLLEFAENFVDGKRNIFLSPYADEYFARSQDTRNDHTSVLSTRNGLDGVRIHVHKHFITDIPLQELLNSFAKREHSRFIVPPGVYDYADERKYAIEKSDASRICTVWILADHGMNENIFSTKQKSDRLLLIAYAQLLQNSNQFCLFKERKPAWSSPVTLPHTLSTAMVNISRSSLSTMQSAEKRTRHSQKQNIVILDPFAETGTCLLDSYFRYGETP